MEGRITQRGKKPRRRLGRDSILLTWGAIIRHPWNRAVSQRATQVGKGEEAKSARQKKTQKGLIIFSCWGRGWGGWLKLTRRDV